MRFLIGAKRLLVIGGDGIRLHRAPEGTHFEPKDYAGSKIMVLKPDAVKESLDDLTKNVANAVAGRSVDNALLFHAERTEELLKRVLKADTASQAAELVATEIKFTEQRMQERQEGMKV